jgi:transcriptional regulator with XRE-family HTH domain
MTPSDVVAGRVRDIRHKRGLTVAQLAARLADRGMPGLTEQALYNLEAGRPDRRGLRRRAVSVDELLALAYALEVSPLDLLVPIDDEQTISVPGTGHGEWPREQVRDWVRAWAPLPGIDERLFYAELPPEEWRQALDRRRGGKEER